MTPCFLVWRHRHFIVSSCFHNREWWTFHPENKGNRIHGNGGTYLGNYTASHSRMQYCILHNSCSLRPKISAFSIIFLINHVLLIFACWMCTRVLFNVYTCTVQTLRDIRVLQRDVVPSGDNLPQLSRVSSTPILPWRWIQQSSKILANFLPDCTVSHPRIQQPNFTFPHMAKHSPN